VADETEKSGAVAGRFTGLPVRTVKGIQVPVAATFRSRLLGLSFLDRDIAGPGLLIPGCRSVHSFGMRFAIEVLFLDESGDLLRRCRDVPPRRCLFTKGAHSVLELVQGGEVPYPGA